MIFAYDLETSRIEEGTPDLLYITGFGENFNLSMPILGTNKYQAFCTILETYFLIPEFNGAQFVAWNGNKFDAYFIASALLMSERWILQPYLTATKALRGLRVKTRRRTKSKKAKIYKFEFLDGIAMTGIVGKKLEQFLETFSPDTPKMSITCPQCGAACTFEKCEKCGNENIQFNYKIKAHVDYAERDSEGLFYGMKKVEKIMTGLVAPDLLETDERIRLKPTVGNLAIHYFMANVPEGKELKRPWGKLREILNGPIKRGGYCWCQRQYVGPVWKYDINQAYAAAMREAELPCGDYAWTREYIERSPGIYQTIISRDTPSPIPFYYKIEKDNIGRFTLGEKFVDCWLTSIEIDHLKSEGWNVEIYGGYIWDDAFNFSPVVDDLERLRASDNDGPSGPLGTMVKAIGNNAYGKTLEQLNGQELILAREAPEGFDLYDPIDETAAYVFCRNRPAFPKDYHLPQIGVFITAHVRCKVRSAALLRPHAFLTADTDCVAFSEPVNLPISKTEYGKWKIEAEGVIYRIIGKKIYHGDDGTIKAKGLRIKDLRLLDYEKWLNGKPPVQNQTQRNNFLKFIAGFDMFRIQERNGTDVTKSKIYGVENGLFKPK